MEKPYPACNHLFAKRSYRLFWRLLLASTLVATMWALGCDSDEEEEPKEEDAGAEKADPIELLDNAAVVDSYLVMADKEGDQAFVLDLSDGEDLLQEDGSDDEKDAGNGKDSEDTDRLLPFLTKTELAPNPFWMEPREGESQALILSAGRRGVAQPAVLSRLDVEGDMVAYEVGAPFDAMLQAEDGSFALLHYAQGTDELLFSTDELAIVKLSGRGSVARKNIDIPRGARTSIALSPPIEFDNRDTVIAVLLSEAYVTLVDLDEPKRTPTRVKLGSAEGDQAVQPEQVVFGGDEEWEKIYVRAKNANDVFVLTLASRDDDEKDFETSFELLPVGEEPSDLAFYDDGDVEHLMVLLASSAEVHLIPLDAPAAPASSRSQEAPDGGVEESSGQSSTSSGETVVIELDIDADRVVLFEAGDEGDEDEEEWRALLYKPESKKLAILDLHDAETLLDSSVQTFSVREDISEVVLLEEHDLALVLHESSKVDVLDLVERTVSSIVVNGNVKNAIYSTDEPRLWIAPPGQHFVGYVDLDTRRTGEVLVDEKIKELVVMPEVDLVVAIHDNEEGSLTVLSAKDPSRDTAVRLKGFAEAEPFDTEEEE